MLEKTNFWDAIISLSSLSLAFMLLAFGETDLILMVFVFAIFTTGNALLGVYNKNGVSWFWTFMCGLLLVMITLILTFLVEPIYVLGLYVGFTLFAVIYYLSLRFPSLGRVKYELGFWKATILTGFTGGIFAAIVSPLPTDEVVRSTVFLFLVTTLCYVISEFVEREIEVKR